MVTSFKRSRACPATLSAPKPAAGHHWPTPLRRLLDTPGEVWVKSLVGTAPFSWVLVHTRFCLCPPRVYFPVLCKFWQLCGGVNGDRLQEGLCHTPVYCTQSPAPAAVHCWPVPPKETLKRSSASVSVGPLGPGAHKVCLSPLSISGGNGVWF